MFDALIEPLRRSAQVGTIFGDPIQAAGKTIIPVARIGYGFGGGANTETEAEGDETEEELEMGGGGGVGAVPIGVMEVSPSRTRFIPIRGRRRLVAAFLAGAAAGYWLARASSTS
jgi:uncharacterized spore protein YtfJ